MKLSLFFSLLQLLTIQKFQNQISSLQLEISSLTTLQTSKSFLKGKEDNLLQEFKEENLLQVIYKYYTHTPFTHYLIGNDQTIKKRYL